MQLRGDSEMTEVGVDKIINILALDDDPKRKKKYLAMGNENLTVDFIDLKDKDTSEEVKKLKGKSPDIIFVDHRLDHTTKESKEFMPTGKNVTPFLRDIWPNTPIFGVTAAKSDCIKQDGNTYYEEVFDINKISQLRNFVPRVIEGYQTLGELIARDRNAAGFVELLKAPEEEITSVLHSIPDEIRTLDTGNFAHAIYRWFRRTLHGHAGFLYNKEWAAITMGINPEHFEKHSVAFDDAKYAGIWSDPNEPRWWKKKLYELAIAERKSPRESVQSAACRRFNIPEKHKSICEVCGKTYPEVLAFTDEGLLADLVPAHLGCSNPHPRRFVSLSFEEPRIIV